MDKPIDRKGASAYYDARMQRDSDTIKGMFAVDTDGAARNRKRIAKKQKYSLTNNSKSGDTCDLFQRSNRMARMQKIGVDGVAATFSIIKPSGTTMLGGKLIPVRLATR